MRRLLDQMQYYINHKLHLRSQFLDSLTEPEVLCALGAASDVSRQPRDWKELLLCCLQKQ